MEESKKPMQLSQIFISDGNQSMGETLEGYTQTVRALFPGAKYVRYGDNEIQEFLADKFPREVLTAYRKLVPYSYKSDLARYCILHEMGGWYFDIGLIGAGKPIAVTQEVDMLVFRDIQPPSLTSYACSNSAIYCRARHPALEMAIELVVENVKKRHYGMTALCPTGPSLWGRAIAMVGLERTCVIGDLVELTPTHRKRNIALVLPDGTIVAYRKPSLGGDLRSLGAVGTNNYNELWRARKVYLD